MMTPVGRLLLVRSTPRNELVGAMAWLTVPALVAPVTGPLIGGFLTTYLSWHWIFWINIPIGIAGIILVGIYLNVPDERTPRPVDCPAFSSPPSRCRDRCWAFRSSACRRCRFSMAT